MSVEERQQLLLLLEKGRITPEQALALIKELEQEPEGDAFPRRIEAGAGSMSEPSTGFDEAPLADSASGLEHAAAQARSLWQIPLWIGAGITVLSALGTYYIIQSAGYNFWFYCMWLPFMLGVALMALGGWSRTARWLFVNVDRSRNRDGGPRRIFVGLPLPLELAAWFMRSFGRYIHGMQGANMDVIVQAISAANSMDTPFIVNMDDSEGGERVQVFIG